MNLEFDFSVVLYRGSKSGLEFGIRGRVASAALTVALYTSHIMCVYVTS